DAGRPLGAGRRRAPGGRFGPADRCGGPGRQPSRPGRVPTADLRAWRRGTRRRAERDHRLAGGGRPPRGGPTLCGRPAPRRAAVRRGGCRGSGRGRADHPRRHQPPGEPRLPRRGRRQRTHRSVASRRRPGRGESPPGSGALPQRQRHPHRHRGQRGGPHAVAAALLLGHVYLPGSPGSPRLRGGPAWRVAAAEVDEGEVSDMIDGYRLRSFLRRLGTTSMVALRSVVTIRPRLVQSARAWVLAVLAVIAVLVVYYGLSDRHTPFPSDAYVQAYVIQVAARVEGQVVRVHVKENQTVKKGEVLFEIDPRPFQYRVALLEAKEVDVAQQVAQMESELSAARADDARLAAE